MHMTGDVHDYIERNSDFAFSLLTDLARIPAPSNHEERRAQFIKAWLESQGCEGVFVDEALNVVYPVGDTGNNALSVFMAHTDVVFPDTDELPVVVEDGLVKAPGIGDDTANLVALLMAAKYVAERKLRPTDGNGVLFVANSGEEGLGNLKGSRRVCEVYGTRIRQFVSFDGTYRGIVDKAVGSKRFEVIVRTEGGHSYGDFGNRNAIAYLASMIDTLYTMKVPQTGHTTYNVGLISGGTSVNTIAQEARMSYEFRSDEREDLVCMERHFEAVVDAYRCKGVEIEVRLLGERPCSGAVDQELQRMLVLSARDAIASQTDQIPDCRPGSTDCNIPLSLGIPSVCFGCYLGGGAHTYEEWVEIASLVPGRKAAFAMVLSQFC